MVLNKRDSPDREKSEGKKIAAEGDFSNFPISEKTASHLRSVGIESLFPIQAKTFMPIYEAYDLVGKDRTGSGKTLAFSLPILERLRRKERYFTQRQGQEPFILCVVPTRELAIQVSKEFERFKNEPNEYRVISAYGGTELYQQRADIQRGVEIVVGTPGRLIDLLDRGVLSLRKLKSFILDETDEMLNMGFKDDIEKMMDFAKRHIQEAGRGADELQVLLFSATIPDWVKKAASKFMKEDFHFIDMIRDAHNRTSKTVEHLSMFVPNRESKIPSVGDLIQVYGGSICRSIVFTDKKAEANEVLLKGNLKVEAGALHGDIPQKQREVTLESFRKGKVKCLVATNVAARGLDIPEVDLIVQLSPPEDIESYIHRSGRTGRAGKNGVCITFYSRSQQDLMNRIEGRAGIKFKKVGAPQPLDMLKAVARDVSHQLEGVSSEMVEIFKENASEVLRTYTPEEALGRAIAVISGCEKVRQRSLLSSAEGYVTFILKSQFEVRTASYFWSFLRNNFNADLVAAVQTVKLLRDKMGAVLDIKEEYSEELKQAISNGQGGIRGEVAVKLPDLEEEISRGGRGGEYKQRENWGSNNNNRRSFNDEAKLYVANLGDSSELELRDLVYDNRFKPTDVFVVKGPDGVSKGFGYVRFNSKQEAEQACQVLNRQRLNGRTIRIEFARSRN